MRNLMKAIPYDGAGIRSSALSYFVYKQSERGTENPYTPEKELLLIRVTLYIHQQ